eukprot:TRINITY_DN646_c0_g1_i1.p1 TRINITY_DN646_c0_g1~~TRINITY_DN646_c0_g1_i1.p1  ORF type:complete len:1015 (-),score=178.88 TRINITY_DN646_c0_g1_i1:120-3164(-)
MKQSPKYTPKATKPAASAPKTVQTNITNPYANVQLKPTSKVTTKVTTTTTYSFSSTSTATSTSTSAPTKTTKTATKTEIISSTKPMDYKPFEGKVEVSVTSMSSTPNSSLASNNVFHKLPPSSSTVVVSSVPPFKKIPPSQQPNSGSQLHSPKNSPSSLSMANKEKDGSTTKTNVLAQSRTAVPCPFRNDRGSQARSVLTSSSYQNIPSNNHSQALVAVNATFHSAEIIKKAFLSNNNPSRQAYASNNNSGRPEAVKVKEPVLARKQKGYALFIDDINFEHLFATSGRLDAETVKKLEDGLSLLKYYPDKSPSQIRLWYSQKTDEIFYERKSKSNSSAQTNKIIPLADILELRLGRKTTGFELYDNSHPLEPESEKYSLSIISTTNVLNLVAPDLATWKSLTFGMIYLIEVLKREKMEAVYLKKLWVILGNEPTISVQKIKKDFLPVLSISSDSAVEQLLEEVSSASKAYKVDFPGFLKFFLSFRERQEIKAIFLRYSKNEELSEAEFLSFLHKEQKETSVTLEQAKTLISFITNTWPPEAGKKRTVLYSDQFEAFLSSDLNEAFDSAYDKVTQDMKQPLNCYYISSSHNTYLEGNQFNGISSVDMYVRVLKTGCRCIELDTWDGPDGKPLILHGHTLTTTIKFEPVVRAVKNYAFYASPYPLILSIENHCSEAQQIEMANVFKSILGDLIALPTWQTSPMNRLPSPTDLMKKILIKGATLYHSVTGEEKKGIAPQLSDITYLSTEPFLGFDKDGACYQMSSFSETKQLNSQELMAYNTRQFSRVYPAGTRVNSTNYDPWPWWNCGSQMIALNYQTPGAFMWCNEAKFKLNGGCGYLLKPPELWEPFDPESSTLPNFVGSHIKSVTVEIISARSIPSAQSLLTKGKARKAKLDKLVDKTPLVEKIKGMGTTSLLSPSVEVRTYGLSCDAKKFRTSVSANNGFNPRWVQKFKFDLKMSETAVMLFIIKDDKSKLAYYSIPVPAIRPGYRILQMRRTDGHMIPLCNLFCHFELEYQ